MLDQSPKDAAAAIRAADAHGPLSLAGEAGVDGYSGEKVIGLLQRLTAVYCGDGAAYVEIGVFRGLTLLSVAGENPSVPCFGIDNFSLFNEGGSNLAIVREKAAARDIQNASILDMDFEPALAGLKTKIGVLFVDGPHDYRSQIMCLLLAVRHLADDAVMIVDDANYPHVRQATADFLAAFPDFTLLAEAYTPAHPANMTEAGKALHIKGWWNGVNVIVKDRTLPRRSPPTGPKALHELSHDVFRHEFAEAAFPILKIGQSALDGAISHEEAGRQATALLASQRGRNPRRFRHQNTYSAELPAFAVYD